MVYLSIAEKQRLEEERMMKETMENREREWLAKEKAYQEKEEQLMAKQQEMEEAFQECEKKMLTKHQICKKLLLRYKKEIEETLANWDEAEEKHKDKVVNNELTQSIITAQGEKVTMDVSGFQSEPVKSQLGARGDSEMESVAQPEADQVNNKRPEPEMVLFDTDSASRNKRSRRRQRRKHKQAEVANKVSEGTQFEPTEQFSEVQDKATEGESETTVEDSESTQSPKDIQDTETFTTLLECEGMESQGELAETQIEATVDQVDCEIKVYIAGEPPADPHDGLADPPATRLEPKIIETSQAETTLSGEAQSGDSLVNTEPLEPVTIPMKEEIVQDFKSASKDKRKRGKRRGKRKV